MSTSAGWHFSKPKSKFATIVDGDSVISHKYEFDALIMQEIESLRSILLAGRRINTVFRATIKDEPVKIGKGKLRVFGACDVSFATLVRQYFSPLIRVMYENWLDFETAVGINAYGPEWDIAYKHLIQFGSKRTIAGDYKNYDKTMSARLIKMAFRALIRLARKSGNYSEDDIKVMKGIATEIAHPIYEYDGCFIRVDGSNPSGNPLTVIINCIVNCFLNRYIFKKFYPDLTFAEFVKLFVYGDDDVKTVSPEIDKFTYETCQSTLAECGITWTDSLKTPGLILRAFDDLDELDANGVSVVNFLKRGFIYHNDLKRVVAPLDRDSMSKMMFVFSSKAKGLEVAILHVQSMGTYLREALLHGREFYEKSREGILQLCTSRKYVYHISEFPPYEEAVKNFAKYLPRNFNNSVLYVSWDDIREEDFIASTLQPHLLVDSPIGDRLEEIGADLPSTVEETVLQECSSSTLQPLFEGGLGLPPESNTDSTQEERTIGCDTYPHRAPPCEMEQLEPHVGEAKTTQFTDALNVVNDLSTTMDSTALCTEDNLSLSAFLARPFRIRSFSWNPSVTFNEDFNPWNDFLTRTNVVEKIKYYRLIRGTLHVKFVLNGSKFHYGRLVACYEPLPNSKGFYSQFPTAIINTMSLMALTQRPCSYLDPCTSQGAEMILPFIFPKDAIDLVTAEYEDMGSMRMFEIASLKTVGEVTSAIVPVVVYAWMTDVTLSVPTRLAPASLAPQSGDEYGTGPISRPASILSSLAGKLKNVPYIGKYALATQMAAGTTAEVARAFGYSRPTDIVQPQIFRRVITGQMACTNVPDTSVRLSLDAKQEITVDPRTAGASSEDQMSIEYIARKEAYIGRGEWSETTAMQDKIFSAKVTPKIFVNEAGETEGERIQTSPCGMLCGLFNFWRADMVYRFSVPKSAFHVGRLRIVYEPTVGSATSVFNDDNVRYSWIMDLQDSNEIEIKIGWATGTNYLHLHTTGALIYSASQDPVEGASYDLQCINGILEVFVETPLRTPNSTTSHPVSLLVFAHAENLELAEPNDQCFTVYGHSPVLLPQSGDSPDEAIEEEAAEQHEVANIISPDLSMFIFFGERVVSIRQLLKRYCRSSTSYLSAPTTSGNLSADISLRRPSFPLYMGSYTGLPNGTVTTVATPPFLGQTFAYTTPLNWFTPCYVGWRGAIRWKKILNKSANTVPRFDQLQVALGRDLGYGIQLAYHAFGTQTQQQLASSPCFSGSTMNAVQEPLEFEVPYYNHLRFSPARDYGVWQTSAESQLNPTEFRRAKQSFRVRYTTPISAIAYANLESYVAAGEDFSLFMFVNTPPIWKITYRVS